LVVVLARRPSGGCGALPGLDGRLRRRSSGDGREGPRDVFCQSKSFGFARSTPSGGLGEEGVVAGDNKSEKRTRRVSVTTRNKRWRLELS